jgi:hypothetical protein
LKAEVMAGSKRNIAGESQKPRRVRKPNLYKPYYSREFRDVVRYIQNVLKKKVYLIGVRALFEGGVPVWRFTDDFDVYTPLNEDEKEKIIKYVRGKYEKSKHVWSRFGFALDFDPIGHIDVNMVPPSIFDESWEEEIIKINDVNVFLPPLEDVLIMKLLSPRRKDRKDVGVTLRLGREKIDFERLKAKAEKAGVMKKLVKIAKRYAVSLN